MTSSNFETLRLIVVLAIILLRFSLIGRYLQSYLNLAPSKLSRLRKEAGLITNLELQQTVARIFYYLCIVSLQFLAPIFLTLYTILLLKILGNFHWINHNPSFSYEAISPETMSSNPLAYYSLRSVFTPILFRGILSYMTWWMSTVWFITSVIGYFYHSYYSQTIV